MSLDRDDLIRGLSDVVALLRERGEPAGIRIIGGAALSPRYFERRTTEDVDAKVHPPGAAVSAAVEIGAANGWPEDWLNTKADHFIPIATDVGWESLYVGGQVSIWVASAARLRMSDWCHATPSSFYSSRHARLASHVIWSGILSEAAIIREHHTMTTTQPITGWTADRLDNLSGQQYLITGGNSGIGFEAASHLRRAQADVFIAARSATKGADAVARLKQIPGGGDVNLIQLDLASVQSIRQANDSIRTHTDGLDGVVNNAGIMQTPQLQTADGFELQFGTNHLGHFLLNYLTFDLVAARSGRIVPVSSIVHHSAPGINFDDPMFTSDYSPSKAYSQSKLANLMYGLELARRLEASESRVIAVTAHPGYSATNLQSTGPTGIYKMIYKVTNKLVAQSPSAGALPEVLAVAGDEARNGAYYGPTRFGDSRGPVGESRISDAAQDHEAAARLWALSEELLGITWRLAS